MDKETAPVQKENPTNEIIALMERHKILLASLLGAGAATFAGAVALFLYLKERTQSDSLIGQIASDLTKDFTSSPNKGDNLAIVNISEWLAQLIIEDKGGGSEVIDAIKEVNQEVVPALGFPQVNDYNQQTAIQSLSEKIIVASAAFGAALKVLVEPKEGN